MNKEQSRYIFVHTTEERNTKSNEFQEMYNKICNALTKDLYNQGMERVKQNPFTFYTPNEFIHKQYLGGNLSFDDYYLVYSNDFNVFCLHITDNKKLYADYLTKTYNLKCLNKNYRKNNILFETKDIDQLYTLLKLKGL